jgi:REP element-mobilizing transposase RayT
MQAIVLPVNIYLIEHMSEKYKVGDQTIPHFITITVIDWVDLFTRAVYKDIVLDSLNYCREHKGLTIHAYCIMPSHVHLIVSSENEMLNAIIRDFKKFTSKELVKSIKSTPESRREWLLNKFEYAAGRIRRGANYKLWQDGFHPVELNTNKMFAERLEYIHNNPVEEGITWTPEGYKYSSASNYSGVESIMVIDSV